MATLTFWLWPALVSSLGDRDADVREEAMRLLAGAPRGVLLEAAKDPDPEIAARAEMLAGGAYEDWRRQFEAGWEGAFPKEQFERCSRYLLGIIRSPGVDLRKRCRTLEILMLGGDPRLIPDLIALLWEPGERVMHGR